MYRLIIAPLLLAAYAGSAGAQQELRVGVNAEAAPFGFLDLRTNETVGFSVDVVRAIAADLGFELSFVPMTFAELIPALLDEQVDIVAANVGITEERRSLVSFTRPVSGHYDGLLVAAADLNDYRSLQDLAGEVVGTTIGTIYWDTLVALEIFREVRPYATRLDLTRAVATGEIRAALVLGPGYAYDIEVRGVYSGVKLAPNYEPLFDTVMGFAVRHEDTELLARLDQVITALEVSGTLMSLRTLWRVPPPPHI